ncbi:MAG: hypothetical protein JWQ56_3549 [Pseudarthrobacter sp.]|nr:hypothetical protein [Pseudarthrobacter sp.]
MVFSACLSIVLAGCRPLGNADTGTPLPLNPKSAPYNAKGDGVSDDTAALQAWLNAGGVRLANGTYRVVRGLILAGNDRRFYTDNARILADALDITVLTATGKNASIRADIDGNHKAAYGLKVTGAGAVVENGRYENFWSATQSARGIDATTSGGIIIRDNVIRNVESVGDETRGNGPGLSRGIGLNAKVPASAKSLITGNHIENITGEEGDAIHVLFFDGRSDCFNSGNVTISDNTIRNVSRRFIKIQASNVAVLRNRLDFDLTRLPANPSSAIDVIRSEYVKVIGNEINPNLLRNGIAVNGASTRRLRGIDIRDNVLRQNEDKTVAGIYLKWTTSPIVQSNSVYGGGVDVLLGSSNNAVVRDNAHYPGN